MKRKAQSEVITTVLIILLVLAAVFIVYVAVRSMVSTSTNTATEKSKCLDIQLSVVSTNSTQKNVTITRLAGGEDSDMKDVAILSDGVATTISYPADKSLKQLETKTYAVSSLTANKLVQVAAILSSGTKCDISASGTAV